MPPMSTVGVIDWGSCHYTPRCGNDSEICNQNRFCKKKRVWERKSARRWKLFLWWVGLPFLILVVIVMISVCSVCVVI